MDTQAKGTAIGALIPLAAAATAAFNVWNPTDVQVASLGALYGGVLVVIGLFVRSKVTPVQ